MIWNNKKYISKPLLVKEDSAIQKHRRWFSQFYSENSPRLQYQRDTLDFWPPWTTGRRDQQRRCQVRVDINQRSQRRAARIDFLINSWTKGDMACLCDQGWELFRKPETYVKADFSSFIFSQVPTAVMSAGWTGVTGWIQPVNVRFGWTIANI